MKRAVFIVGRITSHLYASAGVARRLQAHGWTVEYWGDARTESLITGQGFAFRSVELLHRIEGSIRIPRRAILHPRATWHKISLRRQWHQTLDDTLDVIDQSIDTLLLPAPPRLIVFSPLLLAYYPVFWKRGITCVVLSTKPIALPDPLVPPHTSGLVPNNTRTSRALTRFAWQRLRLKAARQTLTSIAARRVGIYTFRELLSRIAQRAQFPLEQELIPRWIPYDLHFRSVREWALWTPDMDMPRARPLPENVRYIGPCVDLDRRAVKTVLQKSADAQHCIYVCMGTTSQFHWNQDLSLLSRIIQAFRHLPGIAVVMSTGDARTVAALANDAPNVVVTAFLSQLEVLASADLAITHAGAGTVRESVLLGVPLLAYPREYDQHGNAARIECLGIGLRGSRSFDSPASIRTKALGIMSNVAYRNNVIALKAKVECCEGRLFAEALEDLGPERERSHPRAAP